MNPNTPSPQNQTHLDPPPDFTVTIQDRNDYGYTANELLPLEKPKALQMFDADMPIFALYSDGSEAEMSERSEILAHQGLFGIEADVWHYICATQEKREQTFLSSNSNAFAIYQLSEAKENRPYSFATTDELTQMGHSIEQQRYQFCYAGKLPMNLSSAEAEATALNRIYETFNVDRPSNFMGHSLSVSDVVALNRHGTVTFHFVDRIGFKELPHFTNRCKTELAKEPPSLLQKLHQNKNLIRKPTPKPPSYGKQKER